MPRGPGSLTNDCRNGVSISVAATIARIKAANGHRTSNARIAPGPRSPDDRQLHSATIIGPVPRRSCVAVARTAQYGEAEHVALPECITGQRRYNVLS
jgi:hypothetical protein